MYLLAIILPPVAVLMAGKPVQAVIAFLLWPFFIFPSVIYAIAVVNEAKNERNTDRIVDAISRSSDANRRVNRRREEEPRESAGSQSDFDFN